MVSHTLCQNSPFLSFLTKNGANEVTNDKGVLVKEYTLYKNPEGKMVAKKYRMA